MTKIQDISNLKNTLKETLVALNGTKEEIERPYVDKALAVIESEIKTAQDAFLYFASLNLLNSYVKTHKKEISYGFKSKVIPGIEKIVQSEIENVLFGYDEKEKCTLVNVGGMQFTFHGTSLSDFLKGVREEGNEYHDHYTTEEWEGLRLQPLAKSVFEFAEKLDGLTIDVESLLDNESELQ